MRAQAAAATPGSSMCAASTSNSCLLTRECCFEGIRRHSRGLEFQRFKLRVELAEGRPPEGRRIKRHCGCVGCGSRCSRPRGACLLLLSGLLRLYWILQQHRGERARSKPALGDDRFAAASAHYRDTAAGAGRHGAIGASCWSVALLSAAPQNSGAAPQLLPPPPITGAGSRWPSGTAHRLTAFPRDPAVSAPPQKAAGAVIDREAALVGCPSPSCTLWIGVDVYARYRKVCKRLRDGWACICTAVLLKDDAQPSSRPQRALHLDNLLLHIRHACWGLQRDAAAPSGTAYC